MWIVRMPHPPRHARSTRTRWQLDRRRYSQRSGHGSISEMGRFANAVRVDLKFETSCIMIGILLDAY